MVNFGGGQFGDGATNMHVVKSASDVEQRRENTYGMYLAEAGR